MKELPWHRLITGYSPTPSPSFLISVNPFPAITKLQKVRQTQQIYVTPDGGITEDFSSAAQYSITQTGQLSSGGNFVSISGLVPYAVLAPSFYLAAISTNFYDDNGTLVWNNTAFTDNQAWFCVEDFVLNAVFDAQVPDGCSRVSLDLVTVVDVLSPSNGPSSSVSGTVSESVGGSMSGQTPPTSAASSTSTPSSSPTAPVMGSVTSNGVTAEPVGGYLSTPTTPVLYGNSVTVTSLESCLEFCVGYIYFGVSEGK